MSTMRFAKCFRKAFWCSYWSLSVAQGSSLKLIGGIVLLSVIGAAVVINIQKSKAAQPPAPPVVAADVAMAAPAVAAPPVATPEIEIEMGEAPRARFDPQTGKPIPKFDPQTGKQNW